MFYRGNILAIETTLCHEVNTPCDTACGAEALGGEAQRGQASDAGLSLRPTMCSTPSLQERPAETLSLGLWGHGCAEGE